MSNDDSPLMQADGPEGIHRLSGPFFFFALFAVTLSVFLKPMATATDCSVNFGERRVHRGTT
jgi:hypothetical protein